MSLAIRNGLVCIDGHIRRADVIVRDGRIIDVTESPGSNADESVDAEGAFVLPGFIDIHTHLADRIGQYTLADDYRTGTQIAVENGITTIVTFVTETPDVPLEVALSRAEQRAIGNAYADFWWHLTPTRFDGEGWNAIDRLVHRGFRHFKLYTTYRQSGIFTDYDQLEWVFERLADREVQFLVHCEDDDILAAVRLPEEEWKHPIAHARSRPPQSEILAVREVLHRAERQNVAVHIVHVSTPAALELIQEARQSVRVTCETCPQYLFLDESWLRREDGHRWICSPPLRTVPMRDALVNMVREGAVDLFATDHCAFDCDDKDRYSSSVKEVPNGLPGIGALPHLVFALLAQHGDDAVIEMVRRLSEQPARLMGVFPRKGSLQPGADADLCICRTSNSGQKVQSSMGNVHEPYPGLQKTLQFDRVYLQGAEIVRDGRLLNPGERRGKTLWPA